MGARHRDRKDLAIEVATFLETKNVHSSTDCLRNRRSHQGNGRGPRQAISAVSPTPGGVRKRRPAECNRHCCIRKLTPRASLRGRRSLPYSGQAPESGLRDRTVDDGCPRGCRERGGNPVCHGGRLRNRYPDPKAIVKTNPVAHATACKAGRSCCDAAHRQYHCKKTSHDRIPSSVLPPAMRAM
jgi:hypothetical protein